MTKLVFLVGSRELGKESIVDVAFQGATNFEHIKLDDHIERKFPKKFELSSAKKFREFIHEKIEKGILRDFKDKKNVVIDGSFVIKTNRGFLPLLSESFFDAFKPDALILLEFYINKKIPRTREEIERLKHLEEEQEMNRYYASVYSSLSGALFKVIKVRNDGVRKALKEIKESISFILGD